MIFFHAFLGGFKIDLTFPLLSERTVPSAPFITATTTVMPSGIKLNEILEKER